MTTTQAALTFATFLAGPSVILNEHALGRINGLVTLGALALVAAAFLGVLAALVFGGIDTRGKRDEYERIAAGDEDALKRLIDRARVGRRP